MASRLGKNHGGYFGETIDIDRLLHEAVGLARAAGWEVETIFNAPGKEILGLKRRVPTPSRSIYISAGIHGDEPSGPLAVKALLESNRWPDQAEIWLCPCLNPSGFRKNTRENDIGLDLNRDYRNPASPETAAHIKWLEAAPKFDLALILHEDWEASGFYLYEVNPGGLPSDAERVVEGVRAVCPVERADTVDDFPCANGVIRPGFNPWEREKWPEAVYLGVHRASRGYTLETPSDYPLPIRVGAHVAAVAEALADAGRLA